MAVFVVLLVVMLVVRSMVPAWTEARLKAGQVECGQTLRTLGVAALQYADDQGAFPHVMPGKLDADWRSADTPKAWRMLFQTGYLERPEDLLCPVAPARPTTPVA